MLNIEDVLEMWKKDSVIDDLNLDEASKQNSRLHAKYLELLSTTKLKLKKLEMDQKILLRDKWLHFNGKLDKASIDQYGWPYDPFNGLKIMKSDMEYYFNSDAELQKSEAQVTYYKTLVETLQEVLDSVKWRHSTIKNILEWKKFTSGI